MPRGPQDLQVGWPSPRPAPPPSQPPAAQSPSPGPFAGHRSSSHPQRQAPLFSASYWGGGWAQRGKATVQEGMALSPGPLLQDTSRLWLDHVTPTRLSRPSVQASEGERSVGASGHRHKPGFPETCALAACLKKRTSYRLSALPQQTRAQGCCPQNRLGGGRGSGHKAATPSLHTPVRLQGQNRSPDSSPLCAARCQDAVSSGRGWGGLEGSTGGF